MSNILMYILIIFWSSLEDFQRYMLYFLFLWYLYIRFSERLSLVRRFYNTTTIDYGEIKMIKDLFLLLIGFIALIKGADILGLYWICHL